MHSRDLADAGRKVSHEALRQRQRDITTSISLAAEWNAACTGSTAGSGEGWDTIPGAAATWDITDIQDTCLAPGMIAKECRQQIAGGEEKEGRGNADLPVCRSQNVKYLDNIRLYAGESSSAQKLHKAIQQLWKRCAKLRCLGHLDLILEKYTTISCVRQGNKRTGFNRIGIQPAFRPKQFYRYTSRSSNAPRTSCMSWREGMMLLWTAAPTIKSEVMSRSRSAAAGPDICQAATHKVVVSDSNCAVDVCDFRRDTIGHQHSSRCHNRCSSSPSPTLLPPVARKLPMQGPQKQRQPHYCGELPSQPWLPQPLPCGPVKTRQGLC